MQMGGGPDSFCRRWDHIFITKANMSSAFAPSLWPSKLRLSSSRPYTLCKPKPQSLFRFFTRRKPLKDLVPFPTSMQNNQSSGVEENVSTLQYPPTRPDPENVLVVGASGLLGYEVVKELLQTPGRVVIACVKSQSEPLSKALSENAARICQRPSDSQLGYRSPVLKIFEADLSKDIDRIREEIKLQSVGTIVFAASGGQDSQPGEIDNVAVRSLVAAVEPVLGARGEAAEFYLFDFQKNAMQNVANFCSVDDRVMGGVSNSRMLVSNDGNSAFFRGNVTTASKGGFAQVRAGFGFDPNGVPLRIDLSNYAGLLIRCRGDGRRYKINLKDDDRPEKVFQASFGTTLGEWQAIRLPFSDFIPVRRGRIAYGDGPCSGTYAVGLDITKVISIGIVVSKIEPGGGTTPGFENGSFELEVSRITAYRASKPRFVLVSSAAVTRPFWSEVQKTLAKSAADIPIVKINPSNILGHKLAGENAVRRGSIPWTIVRPVGLDDQVPSGRKLFLQQGDTLTGTLSRADAARGIVSTLNTNASTWKTFELGARAAKQEEENVLKPSQFANLQRDALETQFRQETDHLLLEYLSRGKSDL